VPRFEAVRGLPRIYWYLWTGQLINRIGGFVGPFLAIYLRQSQHRTDAESAGIVSLYGAGAWTAGLIGGLLSDVLGRRATLIGGLVASAFCMMGLGLAPSLPLLGLFSFLVGLTTDTYRPAVFAIVADVVPPQDRLRAYSHLYWASNLGFAIATMIAGQVALHGFLPLFLGDAATTLGFAVVAAVMIPETLAPTKSRETFSLTRTARELTLAYRDSALLAFLIVTFPLALTLYQSQFALPEEMASHGLSPAAFGNTMALNGLLIIALQPLAVERLRRFRRARSLAVASLLVGWGFGANAFAQTSWHFALGVVLWTLGEISFAPLSSNVVADLAPPDGRGRYQGAYFMVWALAAVVAPLVGGAGRARMGSRFWVLSLFGGVVIALGHLAIGPMRQARLSVIRGEPSQVTE